MQSTCAPNRLSASPVKVQVCGDFFQDRKLWGIGLLSVQSRERQQEGIFMFLRGAYALGSTGKTCFCFIIASQCLTIITRPQVKST